MFDTLHLWLPAANIAEVSYLNRIPPLLDNLTQHKTADSHFITGNYQGLKVCVSQTGVSLKGSICKYYLQDNIKTLTRQDTERAIQSLTDSFSLPFDTATVRRADIAQSFSLKYEPELYYSFLGECNYYKRLMQPKSLYYSNGMRTKLFYNKMAEAKSKRVKIPEVWNDKNLLRYELRFTSRLPQQFNIYSVKAETLYNETFYIGLIDRWYNEYQAINKLNEITFNLNKMNKPKDFFTQLALLKISEIGQDQALKLVDQLKASHCFEHNEYYSRLKSDIKKLYKSYEVGGSNELITELSKKIMQVKEHYR